MSNFGGASLGPEAGLGAAGGVAGLLTAMLVQRIAGPAADRKMYVVIGMAAVLAAFLPTPFLSMLLCVEVGVALVPQRWEGRSPMHVLSLMFLAVTASFACYYAIEQYPYLSVKQLVVSGRAQRGIQAYDFAIGILIGIMAGLCAAGRCGADRVPRHGNAVRASVGRA